MAGELISIIIPTRNRQYYAEKTIRQIRKLGSEIEIIVQDNSDNNSLEDSISDLICAGEVNYEYESKPIPFSENYDRAAARARAKYLCAIGDDDAVLPNIIKCAKWMEENGIDAVKPAKNLLYCHPGNINKKLNACVRSFQYTGSYRFSNPEAGLIELLNDGGCNYLSKDLVGSYHGLINMNLMNEVKRITGKYYGGLTPDMFSVVCLSLIPNIKFVVVDYPITLPGICPTSGSAASQSGKHVGKLEDAPHLKYLPGYQWDSRIPKFYSVETIWAETMLKAIISMNREELIDKYFNRFALAQHMYKSNKAVRQEILETFDDSTKDYVKSNYRDEIKSQKIHKSAEKIAVKLSGERVIHWHVDEIDKAVELVLEQLKKTDNLTPWA